MCIFRILSIKILSYWQKFVLMQRVRQITSLALWLFNKRLTVSYSVGGRIR